MNLNGATDEIELLSNDGETYVHNTWTDSVPIVIHGNGPAKVNDLTRCCRHGFIWTFCSSSEKFKLLEQLHCSYVVCRTWMSTVQGERLESNDDRRCKRPSASLLSHFLHLVRKLADCLPRRVHRVSNAVPSRIFREDLESDVSEDTLGHSDTQSSV